MLKPYLWASRFLGLCIFSSTFVNAQNYKTTPVSTTNSFEEVYRASESAILDSLAVQPNDSTLLKELKFLNRWAYYWGARSRHPNAVDGGDFEAYKNYHTSVLQGICPRCTTSVNDITWQSEGPDEMTVMGMGIVTALAIHPTNPDIRYAGNNSAGVFKTTDGGANWTNLTDYLQLPSIGIEAIVIDPNNTNTLYIGTSTFVYSDYFGEQGYGIFKSTDAGATWSHLDGLNTTIDVEYAILDVDVNPANSQEIYAVGHNRFYKSIDGGQNWTTWVCPSPQPLKFHDIQIDQNNPDHIYLGSRTRGGDTVIGSYTAELWRSLDGGDSFTKISPPGAVCNRIESDISQADPNHVYVFRDDPTNNDCDLWKSDDQGNSWTVVDTTVGTNQFSFWIGEFEVSDKDVDRFYVGALIMMRYDHLADTIYTISEYGANLTDDHADIREIIQYPQSGVDDRLIIANDGGVANSNDNGGTWKKNNGKGFRMTQFWGMDIPRDGINLNIVGSAMHNSHMMKMQNDWRVFGGGDGNWITRYHFDKNKMTALSNEYIHEFDNFWIKNTWPSQSVLGQWYAGMRIYKDPIDESETWACTKRDLYKFHFGLKDTLNIWHFDRVWKNPEPDSLVPHFKALAISPSHSDVMYLAYETPYWKASENKRRLYKSIDGGQSFQDITGNSGLHHLRWAGIADVIVSPHNPDLVYIALDGFSTSNPCSSSGSSRVLKSVDGGNNWTNMSVGLPIVPVNKLEYHAGTNGLIYAGTDNGVYRFNPASGQWECFNKGLPSIIVTNIELDYCLNKIYVSTYGKGIWSAEIPPLPAQGTTFPLPGYLITGNEVWDYKKHIEGSAINIVAGASLTITDTIHMGPLAKFRVHPGGELIIDGGLVTSACSGTWKGIELRGDDSKPQNASDQPKLTLKNAVIEHAEIAVVCQKFGHENLPDYYKYNTGGGIISATNTIFRNNGMSVHIFPYSEVRTSGYIRPYQAVFSNCDFVINDDFRLPDAHWVTVHLEEVHAPKFLGCRFINSNTGSLKGKGEAIYSLKSGYILSKSSTRNSRVEGYEWGLFALDYNIANRFRISYTDFVGNNIGANLELLQNVSITNCSFDVDQSPNHVGLYLNQSTHYTVQENTFISNGQPSNNGDSYGVVFNQSGPDANLLYKNNFDGFSAALHAIGTNKDAQNTKGLVAQCNRFGDAIPNYYDVYVEVGNNPPGQGGIAAHQGSYSPIQQKVEDLANNLFSQNKNDFYNLGQQPTYFYPEAALNSEPRLEPKNPFQVILSPQTRVFNFNQHCQSKLPSGSVTTLTASLNAATADIQAKKSLLVQFIDGGSTPSLEASILLAGQQDYQDLYVELMSVSPFVSTEALLDLVSKEDFPELALRNVFIANPHGFRNNEVYEALVSKEPALSQQVLDDMESGSKSITSKDILEAEIGQLEIASLDSRSKLLDHYAVLDDATDDPLAWTNTLKQSTEVRHRYQLVDLYISLKNYNSANTELNAIDIELSLSESERQEYQGMLAYYQVVLNQVTAGKSLKSLNESNLQSLSEILAAENGKAAYKAEALLLLNDQEPTITAPLYWPSGQNKREINRNDRPNKPSNKFQLYPNPTSDELVIQWNWFETGLEEAIDIRLYNQQGKIVFSDNNIDHHDNTHVLHLRDLPAGAYILKIQQGDKVIESQTVTLIP